MTAKTPYNVAPMTLALGRRNTSVAGLVEYIAWLPAQAASMVPALGRAVATEPPVKLEPFEQTDAISPGSKFTNQYFYPIPYASPPNLKLICDDKKRVVEIVKEDEFGFVWMIRPCLDDIAEATAKAA